MKHTSLHPSAYFQIFKAMGSNRRQFLGIASEHVANVTAYGQIDSYHITS